MNAHDRAAFNAILRTDFLSFAMQCLMTLNPSTILLQNFHILAMSYQLERIRRGETTRLIINAPPRHLKSLIVSVIWPAFLLGHEPWRRIVTLSYSDELATNHSADFRAIVESPWYQKAFPKMRIRRAVGDHVLTTKRGFRKSTSVYGSLTGFGGEIIIIDDPQKPIDAQSEVKRSQLNRWYTNTLMNRLDNKVSGAIIVVMQRVHLFDLSGYLMENLKNPTVLKLSAITQIDEQIPIGKNRFYFRKAGEALHPELEPLEVLETNRLIMTPDDFAAQYLQEPVPPGGGMIKRSYFRYYKKAPKRSARWQVVQSWDTASKNGAHNDWSVCTTWLTDGKYFYLLDVTRGRFEYPALRATALSLAESFKPDVILIEDASTGVALAQELEDMYDGTVNLVPIEHDKRGRLYVQTYKFSSGRVFFPENAPFLHDLEAELLLFPQGKYDDQVDSISQALAYEGSSYDITQRWVTGEDDEDEDEDVGSEEDGGGKDYNDDDDDDDSNGGNDDWEWRRL